MLQERITLWLCDALTDRRWGPDFCRLRHTQEPYHATASVTSPLFSWAKLAAARVLKPAACLPKSQNASDSQSFTFPPKNVCVARFFTQVGFTVCGKSLQSDGRGKIPISRGFGPVLRSWDRPVRRRQFSLYRPYYFLFHYGIIGPSCPLPWMTRYHPAAIYKTSSCKLPRCQAFRLACHRRPWK